MKNQYFGDIGDYKKYSILHTLGFTGGLKVLVCWMLTADDGRTDGHFTEYLSSPIKWRIYNAPIFDFLSTCVLQQGQRHVSLIEAHGLLPNATFFSPILEDSESARKHYFARLAASASNADLIFFDPDNGLEVTSVRYGRRRSSKYLYWNELISLYQQGFSLLIYQHFRRKRRDIFIQELAHQMINQTASPQVISIRTAHCAYFLIPSVRHLSAIENAAQELANLWHTHFAIERHSLSDR